VKKKKMNTKPFRKSVYKPFFKKERFTKETRNNVSQKKIEAITIAAIIAITIFAGIMVGIASESLDTTNSLNTTNTTVVVEPAEEESAVEIEQLQQWVYDQGYSYTVSESCDRDYRMERIGMDDKEQLGN
jgi:hypothetical protein